MSTQEFTYWSAYFKEKARLEEIASNPKKKSGVADREFKRTMGSRDQ